MTFTPVIKNNSELPIWVKDNHDRLPMKSSKYSMWARLQPSLEVFSDLFKVEMLLINADRYCVAGTGLYKNGISFRVPSDNIVAHALKTGKTAMAINPKQEPICLACSVHTKCQKKINFTSPIYENDKIIAVLQIVVAQSENSQSLTNAERFLTLTRQFVEIAHSTLQDTNMSEDMKTSDIENLYAADIIGESDAILHIKRDILKIAKSNASILIQGESGTGKEIIARAIHQNSSRSNGPFMAINCGAIPESLKESVLFGYEAGTFSGGNPKGKMGLIEVANGGTLFLDEVSETSQSIQISLLRVLQERQLLKVGGAKQVPVDVRFIAASNKNMRSLVEKGDFRNDLFFRLNVIPINIPPLRERSEDIKLLITYFLKQFCEQNNCPYYITTELIDQFEKYHWPGNVRELKNFVEYGVNFCENNTLDMELMKTLFDQARNIDKKTGRERVEIEAEASSEEKIKILKSLEVFGHSLEGKRKVAKHLGISLATLYRKLKKQSSHTG